LKGKKQKNIIKNNSLFFSNISNIVTKNNTDFSETSRWVKKAALTSPLRIIKYPISNKNDFDSTSNIVELFRFRYEENLDAVKN